MLKQEIMSMRGLYVDNYAIFTSSPPSYGETPFGTMTFSEEHQALPDEVKKRHPFTQRKTISHVLLCLIRTRLLTSPDSQPVFNRLLKKCIASLGLPDIHHDVSAKTLSGVLQVVAHESDHKTRLRLHGLLLKNFNEDGSPRPEFFMH